MDAPFDRGEVDRASLDATERLRARLSGKPPADAPRGRRTVLPWVIAAALFVFIAGMVANPWFEASVRTRLPFAQGLVAADEAEVARLQARLALLEARSGPATAPMPVERLARTEAKIETSTDQLAREADRIDRLTSTIADLSARLDADQARGQAIAATATTAATRAEAMLVLVLTRRALAEGRPFGALDPALRRNFEARYPEAVKAIAAVGTTPVTPATLARDFTAMRPLIGGRPQVPQRQSWWGTLTATIGEAVSTPDRPAATATDAAAAAIARGDPAAAALQLRQLKSRPAALTAWLANHDRLVAANQALATLETAVLLPPPASPDAPLPAPRVSAAPAPRPS